jgi:hypothetical protein
VSRWHRTTRRDANHNEIVAALKAAGCSVVDLAAVGGGIPDLLVGVGGDRNLLLEVKNPANKRRSGSTNPTTGPKQAAFRAAWRGPVAVVFTIEEALREIA